MFVLQVLAAAQQTSGRKFRFLRTGRSFCFARLRFARNNAFGLRRCGLKFENWVKIPQRRGVPFIARFANII